MNAPILFDDPLALAEVATTLSKTGMPKHYRPVGFAVALEKFLATWYVPSPTNDDLLVMGKDGLFVWPKKNPSGGF